MVPRSLKILAVLLAAGGSLAAQEAAPAPTPARDAQAVVLAPKAPPAADAPAASDGVTHSVSPGVSAALSFKYSPPTPTPEPKEVPEDKPKNEIPRLPAYVVRESRPPIFTHRELLTNAGVVNLQFRRHPGLAIGNLFGLNDAVAEQMFYDDERQSSITDLVDTAYAMARGGDKDEAVYILQSTQDTYMRTPDLSWNGPGGGGGFSGGGGK
jgi:hypothetical protein